MFDWERANDTELHMSCRSAGYDISPDTPRQDMIRMLKGEIEPGEGPVNPVDSWREALMEFLLDHWAQLRAQLQCPAKELETWTEKSGFGTLVSRKPGLPATRIACRSCLDSQVITCVVKNQTNENLIQIRRKT